ncbi:MAG TPA: [protein-PII] uridylyltransferase [Acidimicrobiales bacterium]|jgi:[protein-PII] uridylyltransferase|nr:[protein-PII] uridylyltransferase [Acidimicrobiales bacterium]
MAAEASLRERRQNLLARHDLQGEDFCRAYAAEADAWLSAVAERASGDSRRHLALLAVGGYGRSSLCPYSDLDVVLVHDGHRDIKALADAIWYPIWDQGVRLDHSVRRPGEMLDAAADDVRVALGLLDARLIWGEAKVADPLLTKVRAAWRDSLGIKYLPELQVQMTERRAAAGDVAFLLEPDLKESHGGLRDVSVLRAISVYAPLLTDYADLDSVDEAEALLTKVRVELHRNAGREQDRLLLQDQDQIAAALAFSDADALMAAVSAAGRQIAWVSDDVWRRRRLWDPSPKPRRRFRRGDPATTAASSRTDTTVLLEPDVVEVDGEIALTADADVSTDPSLAFRLAAAAAERDLPIAKGSLHRLADRMPPPGDPWPPELLAALVRLLGLGRPAIDKLESLDQHGLLVRLIPEWAAVRNKPQRNAYHTYTVDRHLLEAAALAAGLTDTVERPDLLLLGALLHDIGKGFPGDHTEVGMEVVDRMATRMGLSPADVDILVSLVRHHLLLPDTATRRDLDDPTTVSNVARAAGDRVTLQLLGALTEADSRATGPSAWGTWKAGLVAELVRRADRELAGEAQPPGPAAIPAAYRAMMEEVRGSGLPAVSLEPPQVVVAAPDRPGLLSSVAGALALHGMDVRAANVSGADGVAVEVFTVEVARGTWPDTARLREDLAAVLSDRLAIGERLSERERVYPVRRQRAAHVLGTDVSVDNEASETSTVLEVRAPDEVGLLHRITRALFDAQLDVVSARVSTLGELVVDAFYVREATGEKVTEPRRLAEISEAIWAALTS